MGKCINLKCFKKKSISIKKQVFWICLIILFIKSKILANEDAAPLVTEITATIEESNSQCAKQSMPPPSPDFVDIMQLTGAQNKVVVDLRYASENRNIFKRGFYCKNGLRNAYLHKNCASILSDAIKRLDTNPETKNMKLLVWDAFRPNAVQAQMAEIITDRSYVAAPYKPGEDARKIGLHMKGLAIDITLAKSEKIPVSLDMGTDYDDFNFCARIDNENPKGVSPDGKKNCLKPLNKTQLANRQLLRKIL